MQQAVACECPPWLHDDNKTCNWTDPVICVDQTEAELPFTLPSFRMQALSKATYRGYILRSTACTPYLYTSIAQGVFNKTQTLTYLWNTLSITNQTWTIGINSAQPYKRTSGYDRDLPYTLPIFRLHYATSSNATTCQYSVFTQSVNQYMHDQQIQNVYNVLDSVSGAYTRKGCE
jgi:hypothetical protein